MWQDLLKEAGVSIHVIATGGGAGFQQQLWAVPGSSKYLSGTSFPYAQEEQVELLGFTPQSYCDMSAAIDLASAAFMKAYRFDGKKPVGIGLTASVASEKKHRGDHRVYCCIITEDKVLSADYKLVKGSGEFFRKMDGNCCDDMMFYLMCDALGLHHTTFMMEAKDTTDYATYNFWSRPMFAAEGQRFPMPSNTKNLVLMPGSFNPPHVGHFGVANAVSDAYSKRVCFEITANPPHKEKLKVQDLLKRAKLLNGYNRLFTRNLPRYLEKAQAYPGAGFVVGADTMLRMLDPKWGVDPIDLLNQFKKLETNLYVSGRVVDGAFINYDDIYFNMPDRQAKLFATVAYPVAGRWDISSTELRNSVK